MKPIHEHFAPGDNPRPVHLLCVFRDERLLLEYFMAYYRSLGIGHFIMVDNASQDGGGEWLQSQEDINLTLYRTEESYRDADFGMRWITELLDRHCRGGYCLVVDADELFVFDSRRYTSLDDLVGAMETRGANVVPTNLVDMYPRDMSARYSAGSDFRQHSDYFDDWNREYYHQHHPIYGRFFHKTGGVRQRVFGTRVCIHNFPFFRYDFHPIQLAPGRHYFRCERGNLRDSARIRLLDCPAVLLHFKFLKPDFRAFVLRRIRNNQDWDDSSEYRTYLEAMEGDGSLRLFHPDYSRRLTRIGDLDRFFRASNE